MYHFARVSESKLSFRKTMKKIFSQWHMMYRKAIQGCNMTVIHFPEPITVKTANDAMGCDCHTMCHHSIHEVIYTPCRERGAVRDMLTMGGGEKKGKKKKKGKKEETGQKGQTKGAKKEEEKGGEERERGRKRKGEKRGKKGSFISVAKLTTHLGCT